MKAWEIRGGNLRLREVEPAHPGEGETVIRVSYTGICGSDLPKLARPGDFSLPRCWRPGHEIAGTDPAGHTVAVDPLIPCGTCGTCTTGETHLCPSLRRLGWDLPGGYAENVVVPAASIYRLPDGADPHHAVLADPAAVAIHGLRCTPLTAPGQLAVVGAGPVGLLTALYAHVQGWEVTVVHRDGRAPPRVIADTVPAAFRPPFTPGNNNTFDVVVDAASGASAAPVELALRLVRDGGTVVVQNAYQPGVSLPVPLRDLFRRSIRLIGSFSHCRRPPGDFNLALNLLSQCAGSVTHLVTVVGGLADLGAAIIPRAPSAGRQALAIGI